MSFKKINYPVQEPGATWKKINILSLLKAYRILRKLLKKRKNVLEEKADC